MLGFLVITSNTPVSLYLSTTWHCILRQLHTHTYTYNNMREEKQLISSLLLLKTVILFGTLYIRAGSYKVKVVFVATPHS